METVPAPMPPAAASVFLRAADEEEFPLGWECANPALQIECWGTDQAAGAAAALVIES
jgi:hypothetical protein